MRRGDASCQAASDVWLTVAVPGPLQNSGRGSASERKWAGLAWLQPLVSRPKAQGLPPLLTWPASPQPTFFCGLATSLPPHQTTPIPQGKDVLSLFSEHLLCLCPFPSCPTSDKYRHLDPTAHNPHLSLPCRPAVAMAISIEELDVLVRSFYEGRGEQVRTSVHFCMTTVGEFADHTLLYSKKPPRPL